MEMLLLILILFSIFLQSITFLLNWSTKNYNDRHNQ